MWGFGYGIGTHLKTTGKMKTQLELLSYHINEGSKWTNTYNGLQQLKLSFTKKMGDHYGLFLAPTINLMITDNMKNHGDDFQSAFAPYALFSNEGNKTTLKAWPGLTVGIQVH